MLTPMRTMALAAMVCLVPPLRLLRECQHSLTLPDLFVPRHPLITTYGRPLHQTFRTQVTVHFLWLFAWTCCIC